MIYRNLRRISLTSWIVVAMVIGVIVGWAFPAFAVNLKPLSTVFLRMIKSIIVPIIFGTLVVGIAGHGDDMKRVGRLALKSIIYFEIVTTIALFIGLGAVNLTKPGVGVSLAGVHSEENKAVLADRASKLSKESTEAAARGDSVTAAAKASQAAEARSLTGAEATSFSSISGWAARDLATRCISQ